MRDTEIQRKRDRETGRQRDRETGRHRQRLKRQRLVGQAYRRDRNRIFTMSMSVRYSMKAGE